MSEYKEKRLAYICEFLTGQMNHWMLFPLFVTAQGCLNGFFEITRPNILLWICCGFLPFFTFLVRARVKRFFPFLLCNLALCGLTLLFPTDIIVEKVIAILCGIGYLIHTFSLRIKAGSMFSAPFPPAVGAGISIFGIFFLHQVSELNWDSYYIFALLGCFALYLIIYYMNHYMSFLSLNESSSGSLPAAEMFHSGMGLVLGYTLFGSIILLLGLNVAWLEAILAVLKKIGFVILRFLFSLLPKSSPAEEVIPEEVVQNTDNAENMMLPPGEPSLFWQILEVLALIFFTCLFAWCIVKALVRLVRFLQNRFGLDFRQRHMGVEESEATDIREKCEREKPFSVRNREFSFFEFLSPAQRIRKLYKKKLLSASAILADGNSEKLALYTARESEKALYADGDVVCMAEVYEKARYSDKSVTAEDVKRMKAACR